jgi:hypothetical protein
MQYLATGAPNTLPGEGYYDICKKCGHHLTECPLLHKYQSTPRNLFFNVCKTIRLKEKDCYAFNLIRECSSDMYMIQEENVAIDESTPQYNNHRGFNPGNT